MAFLISPKLLNYKTVHDSYQEISTFGVKNSDKPRVKQILIYLLLVLSVSCKKIKDSEKKIKTQGSFTPVSAVVPFNAETCPSGWEDFAPAQGRIIFGTGSGNQDSQGAGLTARLRGDFGGLEFTTGIPARSGPGPAVSSPSPSVVLADAMIYLIGMGDVSMGSELTDSNLPPFMTYKYCKKISDSATGLNKAVIATESSCVSPWVANTKLQGRAIMGAGVGNFDSWGLSLLYRNVGDSGGVEDTPNMPACYGLADRGTPGPLLCLAEQNFPAFKTGSGTSTIGGAKTDSNLPPHMVLNLCENTETTSDVSSGAIMAFDLDTCPTGWSIYAGLRGRMILGAGSGNTDAMGNALRTRSVLSTGGLEYTTGVPVDNTLAEDQDIYITSMLAIPGVGMFSELAPNTTINGAKGDSNMPPFYVLLYCKKD